MCKAWADYFVLTEKQLRRGIFKSVQDLEKTIMEFISTHNENKKPFVWVKSAEKILEKVGRARQALTNLQTV